MTGEHSMAPAAVGVSKQLPAVFGPVNRCIYCGKEPPIPLTREHILPQGLGGGIILLKASCGCCQKITSDFETATLRNMYLPYRFRVGLVRHPWEIPEHIEATLEFADRIEVRSIPRTLGPVYVSFPQFELPPGILRGEPLGSENPIRMRLMTIQRGENDASDLAQLGARSMHVTGDFDTQPFF